jgi:hypothetical protein
MNMTFMSVGGRMSRDPNLELGLVHSKDLSLLYEKRIELTSAEQALHKMDPQTS